MRLPESYGLKLAPKLFLNWKAVDWSQMSWRNYPDRRSPPVFEHDKREATIYALLIRLDGGFFGRSDPPTQATTNPLSVTGIEVVAHRLHGNE